MPSGHDGYGGVEPSLPVSSEMQSPPVFSSNVMNCKAAWHAVKPFGPQPSEQICPMIVPGTCLFVVSGSSLSLVRMRPSLRLAGLFTSPSWRPGPMSRLCSASYTNVLGNSMLSLVRQSECDVWARSSWTRPLFTYGPPKITDDCPGASCSG